MFMLVDTLRSVQIPFLIDSELKQWYLDDFSYKKIIIWEQSKGIKLLPVDIVHRMSKLRFWTLGCFND